MEIVITIILVIAVIILLTRPKKANKPDPYTSYRTDNNEFSTLSGQKPVNNPVKNRTLDTGKQKPSTTSKTKNDNNVVSARNSSQTLYSQKRTVKTSSNDSTTITVNGKTVSGADAEVLMDQIFGTLPVSNVTVNTDTDFDKEFEASKKAEEKKARERKEKRKSEEQKQLARLKKELDDIVKFIWPDAEYEDPWNPAWEGTFAGIMFYYSPSKMLYGMYEQLLSNYPRKLSSQQKTWIYYAVGMLFGGSPAYIYYDNDDTILEEYKYLHYPSKLQQILFENSNKYPKLIAAMTAWAVYECDIQCLEDMLSHYHDMGKQEQKDFSRQLVDSLSRTRGDIFTHSLKEIKEIIDAIQNFLEPIVFDDPYDEKKRRESLLYLTQGYDEKMALEEIQGLKTKQKKPKKSVTPPGHEIVTVDIDSPDFDRTILLCQLSHVRWQYDYTTDNPEDREYIKADIRSLTHIDWEDVDRIIEGQNKYLSLQMKAFKEAATQLRKYKIWNKIDKACSASIEVLFKYPDGKAGDVNRGLALCYGIDQPEQVDSLTWKVKIDPRKNKDIIDMMVNGQLGVINDKEETKRLQSEPAAKFLIKYNNYAKLRSVSYNISSIEPATTATYYSIASSVPSNYYHQLRDARTVFYQELIVTTGTSSKWKSEQQVYAVVRYRYPDAVYQYHTRWLGKQSLDVYIPSLSIAIEYQGLQHYEPVDYFGGEEAFQGAIERDQRKKALCEENGVRLIYWKYDEPITDELLQMKLYEPANLTVAVD